MEERERRPNKNLFLVSKEQRRERTWSRQYLNKIQINCFQKLMRNTKFKNATSQKILSRTYKEKFKLSCITVKPRSLKTKILKSSQRN